MSFVLLGILNSQAVAGSIDPSELNPDLWLDASDASTITESGGSVSQWDNKGTLENLSQATSADQPTTGVNTQNGLNVIDFNADFLIGSTKSQWTFLHDGTAYFYIAVFRPTTGKEAFLSHTDNGLSAEIGHFVSGYRASSTQSGYIVSQGVQGDQPVNAGATLLSGNEYSILSYAVDPDNATAADRLEIFKNNEAGVKPNTESGTVSGSSPTTNFILGEFSSFNVEFKLAELIIVSGAEATETNRQLTVNYLNSKWGVF